MTSGLDPCFYVAPLVALLHPRIRPRLFRPYGNLSSGGRFFVRTAVVRQMPGMRPAIVYPLWAEVIHWWFIAPHRLLVEARREGRRAMMRM